MGVSRFSVEKVLSDSPENLRRGIFYCCIIFRQRKSFDRRGEYPDFLSKFFRLTVPKILVEESFTVALISVTERVWIRGGESRYSVEMFLSHGDGKISVRESFVALISGTEEVWRRGVGEYQDLPSKIFCLTVPKYSVGESLDVALFSVTEEVWMRGRGGDFQDIPSKLFCLTVPKISLRNTLLLD